MEAWDQEYLEIDLQGPHVISSVVVQGRYGNGLGQEYAEYFVMMYWREETRTWVEYRQGDNRLLQANNNTYQPVETRLRGNTILTSKVRWENQLNIFSDHAECFDLKVREAQNLISSVFIYFSLRKSD